MISLGYVEKGLWALARAHRVSPMAGHLGAAVVAGYFISEKHPDLDGRVCAGITGELDRIIQGESVFSPREDAPVSVAGLFAPAVEEELFAGSATDDIAAGLARNINEVRSSGHNVIFASIAIRALREFPDFATTSVVEGLCQLVAGFDALGPGSGYYGKQRGRISGNDVRLSDDDGVPVYSDLRGMASAILAELVEHAAERREGFGGMWHVINHAAALAELAAQGYGELALQGLPAQRQHLRLLRTLPDVAEERGAESPTRYDPLTAEFWGGEPIRRERAHLTHRIKTLYGFDVLAGLVEDEDLRVRAHDKLRYLM